MNKFQVGDVVKVVNLGVQVFGWGELIVSKVENTGLTEWVSIKVYSQDGGQSYMASVFELVSGGVCYNE